MAVYNVIYNKDMDFPTIRGGVESTGATVNTVFSGLGVMNITSDNLNFASVSGVVTYEEDASITPVASFEWHQLRVVSRGLPMRETYTAKNLGEGVVVYVVDSGIDANHSEFSHTSIVDLHTHDDFTPDAHGTAVASLIAGDTLGVARNATLKNVKIPFGSTNISVLLAAFDAIVSDHDESTPAIVNCSWVVPKSLVLDTKIGELQADNLIVVAAAGNTGSDANDFSPVGLNSVLGVGASDAYDRVISWGSGDSSNWGPEVDVFAPGIDVSYASMDGSISVGSGTSFAAAVASGVVAQYIADDSEKTAAEIQSLVTTNALVDMLFRNEAVYGTTPNALIHSPNAGMFFVNFPLVEGLNVAPGGTTTFTLEYNTSFVSSVAIQFQARETNYVTPDWITLTGDVLTITPPADITPAKYMVAIQALDANGNMVSMINLKLNISENPETLANEHYRFKEEDGVVVVAAANCYVYSYQCYSTGQACAGAKSGCICYDFGNCATNLTE